MSTVLWPNGKTTMPRMVSGFGPRVAPKKGASTYHRGADFIGFSHIHNVADGVVTVAGTPPGWGGGGVQVWVQHDGFLTRHFHMVRGSIQVRVGERIPAGQVLGAMGMTGTATGVHLHMEVVRNGVQINPLPFLQARINQPAPAGTPKPITPPNPVPTKKEADMATSNAVIFTNDAADKDRSGAIINTESGVFSDFGDFPKSYANTLAVGFGLEHAGQVSRGHFEKLRRDMADLRAQNAAR